MKAPKTRMRRHEAQVVVALVACGVLGVAGPKLVREQICAYARNESATCNYVEVTAQPTPIPSPVQRAIAGVCASPGVPGIAMSPSSTDAAPVDERTGGRPARR
jgi:hypothetical protein